MKIVGCIKFRSIGKERIIEKSNLDNRFGINIVITLYKIIKASAEIAHGSFYPIALVNHLHFKIDDGVIVHKNPDIQDEGFIRDMFSKDDFIFDDYGLDILHLHMKKRCNQPL